MNQKQIERNVNHGLTELRTLRDELRVQAHLAGLEAKTRWENELEPRIDKVEKAGRELTEAAHLALQEVLAQMRQFRAAVTNQKPVHKA